VDKNLMNVDFNYSDCTKVGCNIARDGMQFDSLCYRYRDGMILYVRDIVTV
jgi:hypothetical protein